MSLPRFYSPAPLSLGSRVDLPEALVRHAVRVLRLAKGDSLLLFDGKGGEYVAHLVEVGRHSASADILEWRDIERESPRYITLYQALQSGDKMDLTIQKAVELGVSQIVPLVSARSQFKFDTARKAQRLERWQAIALSACEQCQRNTIPPIRAIESFSSGLAAANEGASAGLGTERVELRPKPLRLLLNPQGAHSLKEIAFPPPEVAIDILIGAEGGFSAEEIALAESAGFVSVRFGPRILRTETAGLAVLAAVQQLWGDLN